MCAACASRRIAWSPGLKNSGSSINKLTTSQFANVTATATSNQRNGIKNRPRNLTQNRVEIFISPSGRAWGSVAISAAMMGALPRQSKLPLTPVQRRPGFERASLMDQGPRWRHRGGRDAARVGHPAARRGLAAAAWPPVAVGLVSGVAAEHHRPAARAHVGSGGGAREASKLPTVHIGFNRL